VIGGVGNGGGYDNFLLCFSSMHVFVQATFGGVLIGMASWLLLAGLGRVAGVLHPEARHRRWRLAFLTGLVCAGTLAALVLPPPPVLAPRPAWLLVLAGLLVGIGTRVGSGCTSGHGVCGLGRRSARSLVATLVFMTFGIATVWLTKVLHVPS